MQDDKFVEVAKYVITTNSVSIASVQRDCAIGYPKAFKYFDMMDRFGIIDQNRKKVLMTAEQFVALKQ